MSEKENAMAVRAILLEAANQPTSRIQEFHERILQAPLYVFPKGFDDALPASGRRVTAFRQELMHWMRTGFVLKEGALLLMAGDRLFALVDMEPGSSGLHTWHWLVTVVPDCPDTVSLETALADPSMNFVLSTWFIKSPPEFEEAIDVEASFPYIRAVDRRGSVVEAICDPEHPPHVAEKEVMAFYGLSAIRDANALLLRLGVLMRKGTLEQYRVEVRVH